MPSMLHRYSLFYLERCVILNSVIVLSDDKRKSKKYYLNLRADKRTLEENMIKSTSKLQIDAGQATDHTKYRCYRKKV